MFEKIEEKINGYLCGNVSSCTENLIEIPSNLTSELFLFSYIRKYLKTNIKVGVI